MSGNEIQAWIENDPRLNDLILKIEAEGGSNEEKAERAFFALADLYNLDKMPNQYEGEGSSLFVEHAFLKYMAPNDDPRGRVLTAAYHLVNEMAIPAEVIAEKALGKEPEEGFQVGLRGENYHGEVVFPTLENKSWIELGCCQMMLIQS